MTNSEDPFQERGVSDEPRRGTAWKLLAAALFGIAAVLAALALMAFSQVWSDTADSPDSTYIEAGSLALAIAAAIALVASIALRRS